jgi:hypothetical protein
MDRDDDQRRSDDKRESARRSDPKEQSRDLKRRIEEAKRRHDMPVDSNLGRPDWEERAADGRLDLPENDDN